MALEIERRFLVRSDAWRSSAGPAQPLRQGYLAASADGVTVRMRLRGSDQAWLTLFALELGGGDWVVDCFEAENAPLLIAEVELPQADSPLEIPEWCGLEITGDGRWSNAQLAHRPLQHWCDDDRHRFGFPDGQVRLLRL